MVTAPFTVTMRFGLLLSLPGTYLYGGDGELAAAGRSRMANPLDPLELHGPLLGVLPGEERRGWGGGKEWPSQYNVLYC